METQHPAKRPPPEYHAKWAPKHDIRDTVAVRLAPLGWLGELLNRIVTLISGIAPTGAEPTFVWTRPTFYAAVLTWLLGGAAATLAIMLWAPFWLWPLILVTLMITASGARAGMLTIMHDAIHGWAESSDPRTRRLFWWIGTAMSTLLLVQDFDTYARDHMLHHYKYFATRRDPDVQFLIRLGFLPGMSVPALWRHYRWLRWSPWFHGLYLRKRLSSQFLQGGAVRRSLVTVIWLVVLTVIAMYNLWLPFLVAWAFPVTFLFQQAALEQFLGEHRWLRQYDSNDPKRVEYAQLSSGRFALDPAPARRFPDLRRWLAWGVWWFRLFFVHLPYRSRVIWGDLAHHDEHHLHGLDTLRNRGVALPAWANWMNTSYARRLYEQYRGSDDPQMTAFWNRHEPLQATFKVFSTLDPRGLDVTAVDEHETEYGMLAM